MNFRHALSKWFSIFCGVIIIVMNIFSQALLIPAYILIKPINAKIYRQITVYTQHMLISTGCFINNFWVTSDIKLFVDKDDYKYLGKEKAFVIMNHSTEVDWVILLSLCDHLNVLGSVKFFVKKSVQYIPLIGISFLLLENILLERSFQKDNKNIRNKVKNLINFPSAVWLVLFAEGTRFTNKKQEESINFAKERNLPKLKHHLYPRTKGFTASIPLVKKGFEALYNIELIFSTQGSNPTLLSVIRGEHLEAHFYIRRITMDKLPDAEDKQKEFLLDLYMEKERLQDSFKSAGTFFKSSGVKEVPCTIIKRRMLPTVIFMFWSVVTIYGYIYFAMHLFNAERYIVFSIWIGVVVGGIALTTKIMDFIEMKKE